MTKEEQQFNQWFDEYADGVKVFEEADMKQAYLQGRTDLEKENAELKEQNNHLYADLTMTETEYKELKAKNKWYSEQVCNKECAEVWGYLVKAKEIIKKFSEFANNEIEYNPEHPQEHTDLWNKLCEQAEQFLKEIEK